MYSAVMDLGRKNLPRELGYLFTLGKVKYHDVGLLVLRIGYSMYGNSFSLLYSQVQYFYFYSCGIGRARLSRDQRTIR